MVVSTIGTAPRSPAHEMNARSRHGIGCAIALTSTDSGRATSVSSEAGDHARGRRCSRVIRPGESSSPSITNSPIWASQATPSANDRVAARCGSSALPSTSAATYTAANPEACTAGAAAYAMTARQRTASG